MHTKLKKKLNSAESYLEINYFLNKCKSVRYDIEIILIESSAL